MPNVAGIIQKGDKAGLISFDDGSKPAWTPEFAKAHELLTIGQPLPSDWTVKQSDYGPQAFPPRPKGERPQSAWRNTETGAKYEQERMDRRTALMQAVAVGSGITLELSEKFYQWLRKTAEPSKAHRESGPPSVAQPAHSVSGTSVGAGSGQNQPGGSPAPSGQHVFPKDVAICPHRAALVTYENEQVCSGCGLPDALIGTH